MKILRILSYVSVVAGVLFAAPSSALEPSNTNGLTGHGETLLLVVQ